jgi:hypothetical protein
MPHNAAAMRSHCGGVLRMFILTGESFYMIVLHLRYLGHEGVARQEEHACLDGSVSSDGEGVFSVRCDLSR